MPARYAIHTSTVPHRFKPVTRSGVIAWEEGCIKCAVCVKKQCVYGVYDRRGIDPVQMIESIDNQCMSCLRCVQSCPKELIHKSLNPEYEAMGDAWWTPDIISSLWSQAQTGKIPVSGAGYPGPFSGPGFDAMWTDMSEIVRPTRDGIHGREYINTSVELTRRHSPLVFDAAGELAIDLPAILEIPLPLMLQPATDLVVTVDVLTALAQAARMLGTLMLVSREQWAPALAPFIPHLVPCLDSRRLEALDEQFAGCPAVALTGLEARTEAVSQLRQRHPRLNIFAVLPMDAAAADSAVMLARAGVDAIHCHADNSGNQLGTDQPAFLKEMIRGIHLELVAAGLREQVNLVFSGGIAMAEHMAKAVICGADAIVVDRAAMIAMECRLCGRCSQGLDCPVALDKPFDADWGAQRIVNLMGAWHSQLLEVMGAMGIREARRLRGEVGRSMWFEDLEKDSFGPIFGERRTAAVV
jgi:ferredoxin